jgi:hypothetical protein
MKVEVWTSYYPWNPDSLSHILGELLRAGQDVTLHQRSPALLPQYLREAAPNKMFSEEQRATIRFIRFSEPVPCCACGKRKKHHWTSVEPFRAVIFPKHFGIVLKAGEGPIHIGIAPVCRDHLLAAAYFDEPEETEAATA